MGWDGINEKGGGSPFSDNDKRALFTSIYNDNIYKVSDLYTSSQQP